MDVYSEVSFDKRREGDLATGEKVAPYLGHRKELEKQYEEFIRRLSKACQCMSNASYFQVPVARSVATVRERLYCYELYHQLRTVEPTHKLMLAGELDKAGHPVHGHRRFKPDFLLHSPGEHDNDICVVEVKPGYCQSGQYPSKFKKQIEKDMDSLVYFTKPASRQGYFRGLLLFYGNGKCPTPNKLFVEYALKQLGSLRCISLGWHPGPEAVLHLWKHGEWIPQLTS